MVVWYLCTVFSQGVRYGCTDDKSVCVQSSASVLCWYRVCVCVCRVFGQRHLCAAHPAYHCTDPADGAGHTPHDPHRATLTAARLVHNQLKTLAFTWARSTQPSLSMCLHSLSLSDTHADTFSPFLSPSLTHMNMHICFLPPLSCSHIHMHTYTCTHTHALSLPPCLSHLHIHSLSLCVSLFWQSIQMREG